MEKTIEKAALVVHWPTGPVLACIEHAEKLKALGAFMGSHVHIEPYAGDEPCVNCVNEAAK